MAKRKLNLSKVRQWKQQQAQKDSGNYLNIPGDMEKYKERADKRPAKMDIIPYEVQSTVHPADDVEQGDLFYCRPYKRHAQIGPENEKMVCPRSVRKPCPICEYREALMDDWDANELLIKDLRPSDRVLYYIRDNDDEDKIKVMDISNFGFEDKLNEELVFCEEENSVDHFACLGDEGLTLSVRFITDPKLKKFVRASKIDFRERRKPVDESIVDELPDMDKVLIVKSAEQIKKLFDPEGSLFNAGGAEYEETAETEEDDHEPVSASEECPEGYEWGEADEYGECDLCPDYDECRDRADELDELEKQKTENKKPNRRKRRTA